MTLATTACAPKQNANSSTGTYRSKEVHNYTGIVQKIENNTGYTDPALYSPMYIIRVRIPVPGTAHSIYHYSPCFARMKITWV